MRARRGPVRRSVAATVAALIVLVLGAFTGSPPAISTSPSWPPVSLATAERYFDSALPQPTPHASRRPNIVFVLTDDLSNHLLEYMPHVQALERRGISFTNYTVADSLCCPSRASIFTGEYPHNSKVFENVGTMGGYSSFAAHDDGAHTFAVALHNAGYRTAFAGKYLNGYSPDINGVADVPTGWSSWAGVNGAGTAGGSGYTGGYNEYDYDIALGNHLASFGSRPQDYLTTVLDQLGQHYIRTAPSYQAPFFLELATFSPHAPYVPAPADLGRYPGLTAPHDPAWDTLPSNAPAWLATHSPLTKDQIAICNAAYRGRVLSVLSVDRMIGDLESALRQSGQLANTVFVFSSDNGFHIGDYRLTPGKLTAFDTDVRVPLVIAGPGIARGVKNSDLVQNVDLAPTFDQLAGAQMPGAPGSVDGHSILALLHQQNVTWRTLGLIEQWGQSGIGPTDPDVQAAAAAQPPSYTALRTPNWTYVKYVTGEREFYNRQADPHMLHNIADQLTPSQIAQLDTTITTLSGCVGPSCWQEQTALKLGRLPGWRAR